MTTTSYITRKEAAELSGASESVINKAIEQRVIPTRHIESGAALDVRDVGVLTLFSELTRFALPVKQKKALRSWLRNAAAAEFSLNPALVVRRTEEVDEAITRARRYVELRDRYLESNAEIRGGEPIIRETRIPIRGLAKQIEAGETLDALREDYRHVPEEAFEFAVLWARANPRRGRPASPWKAVAPEREPKRRAALVQARKRRAAATSTSR